MTSLPALFTLVLKTRGQLSPGTRGIGVRRRGGAPSTKPGRVAFVPLRQLQQRFN
jgi:hypothetical protein